ncbi:MAG: hypothetical protein ACYTEZ_11935 [Planctomycetota bacterium]|jgi:hypothetical protein
MRGLAVLLLLAGAARADRNADLAAAAAIREYYRTLRPNQPGIETVRDRLVPIMQDLSPKTGKSIRNVIRRGFDRKYGKDLPYLRCLCEILAAGGKPGIAILGRQYRTSRKNEELCVAMAEVFGECRDPLALNELLKMMHDKRPPVAAAAVKSCAAYAKVKQDKRKEAVKKLVQRYGKVTDLAAGKGPETVQMKMYLALKPAMNTTLKDFTGQELNSAAAYQAWLSENLARPWPE